MSLETKAIADRLGRILMDEIERSTELERQVAALRRRGFQIVVEIADPGSAESARAPVEAPASGLPASKPETAVFALEGSDVTFLESLGIDATRSARRRRSH